MQEQVNEKTVAISVRASKLTGRLLAKAMRGYLKHIREPPKGKSGKQSIRSLNRQGASLESVEITGNNIGTFRRVARKYNIDFALQKDVSTDPPKWFVFFKAKDAAPLEAAFKEFSKEVLQHRERKPSMLTRLAKLKEIIQLMSQPVKIHHRGGHER